MMNTKAKKVIPIEVQKLRQWDAVLFGLRGAIYHSGYIPTEDKKKMLSMVKRVRSAIADTLQLDLFSPEQLNQS